MKPLTPSTPLGSPRTAGQLLDQYNLQMRSALLEMAAGLDRLQRAAGGEAAMRDRRVRALSDACAILTDGEGDRTRRILERLSAEAEGSAS